MEMLNDRDLFNHFSNRNEQIDMTSSKPDEFNMGMPLYNGQIMNNKKNLINNPYINDTKNLNNFMPKELVNEQTTDMFAELENDLTIKNNELLSSKNLNIQSSNFSNNKNEPIDIIEQQITLFEYNYNKSKNKSFLVDINTPFGLSYMWKSLLLLTQSL